MLSLAETRSYYSSPLADSPLPSTPMLSLAETRSYYSSPLKTPLAPSTPVGDTQDSSVLSSDSEDFMLLTTISIAVSIAVTVAVTLLALLMLLVRFQGKKRFATV